MPQTLNVTNAKLILADELIDGSLASANGKITAIETSATQTDAIDFEGDYLVPGLVELHTDHLESHYRPRPEVFWNAMAALQAHDAQIASSGITTVYDALRIGSDADMNYNLGEHVGVLIDTIQTAKNDKRLRADHFIHLRCEMATSDTLEHFEKFYELEVVRLASLMDHTPGQRQFVTMDLYYAYYQGKSGRTDAQMKTFIAARIADQQNYATANRDGVVAMAHNIGLVLASHDDATPAHVAEAKAEGVRISEFPTTLEAAQAARNAGLSILMGAPNVVRGRSHSGNVSATELARENLLDILSSDYVPFSLIHGAFELSQRVDGMSLPMAISLVSKNPATAAGLNDRGEIAIGKRADFCRVKMQGGVPIVRAVWREGERII